MTLFVALLPALSLIPLLATPASAAVSISRAEVSGTRLRIEGRATANRTITVDGVSMGNSTSNGEFRIERDPFTRPSDCTVDVDDGSSSPVIARLFGCTVTSSPPPSSPPPTSPTPAPTSATGQTFTSVSVSPSTVVGGSAAVGTVRFSAATDGAVVTVASSRPDIVTVTGASGLGQEVVVPQGQSSATFPVSTLAVSSTVQVTITATYGAADVTLTTTLTVSPGTAAPADSVQVRRAEWSGRLRIEATSSNANAILTVYLTVSNSFMFNLRNDGGGRYSIEIPWLDNPRNITIRSSFGGSASSTVVSK